MFCYPSFALATRTVFFFPNCSVLFTCRTACIWLICLFIWGFWSRLLVWRNHRCRGRNPCETCNTLICRPMGTFSFLAREIVWVLLRGCLWLFCWAVLSTARIYCISLLAQRLVVPVFLVHAVVQSDCGLIVAGPILSPLHLYTFSSEWGGQLVKLRASWQVTGRNDSFKVLLLTGVRRYPR